MDLLEEYQDLETTATHTTATYAFFKLFQVQLDKSEKALKWGRQASDTTLSDEILYSFKTYLKHARTTLRDDSATPKDCRQMMWYWCQKLLEVGAFDRAVRREIMHWADVCNERTLEGCQLRIESVGGEPAFATVRKESI